MGLARGRARGVHDQAAVDDRVDLGRLDDPPQEGVLGSDADELGAVELARRVAVVDADDGLDLLVLLERLGEPAAPVGRQAGDEDAPGGHGQRAARI